MQNEENEENVSDGQKQENKADMKKGNSALRFVFLYDRSPFSLFCHEVQRPTQSFFLVSPVCLLCVAGRELRSCKLQTKSRLPRGKRPFFCC
jgi:hypothetical protein